MNNNKYVGLWFRDYQQGHGVMYYYNGDRYDGEWFQDKRQGKGTYTFPMEPTTAASGSTT